MIIFTFLSRKKKNILYLIRYDELISIARNIFILKLFIILLVICVIIIILRLAIEDPWDAIVLYYIHHNIKKEKKSLFLTEISARQAR